MNEPTFAEVLAELRELRAEVAALRPLPKEFAPVDGTWPASPLDGGSAQAQTRGLFDRRTALRAGLIVAGAAAIAAAGDAHPAAANDGDNLVLGWQGNASTGATIMSVDAAQTVGLGVWDVSRSTLTSGIFPAISGHAQGSTFNVGVEGYGQGDQIGVRGLSDTSAGVEGKCNDTTGGVGVVGRGFVGVEGSSFSPLQGGIGVEAVVDDGTGLYAHANDAGTGIATHGPTAHLRFDRLTSRAAPTTDSLSHLAGEVVFDSNGNLWFCTVNGSPGTWRKVSGPAAGGAFHPLASPARVYDSRPGTLPAVGSKTPLAPNVSRILDCKVNSSGVPADAVAVMCTLLLVNAANANGNITLWANGVAKPAANTMVWGGSTGRFSSLAVTSCGSSAKVQVNASAKTDVVLDIVGYYR